MSTEVTTTQNTIVISDNKAVATVQKALPELMALAKMNYPSMDQDSILGLIQGEFSHLEYIASVKPKILDCTPSSLIVGIKQVIKKNLSLDPSLGLVYCVPQGVNLGTKESPKWITILQVNETVDGLLSVALQSSSILDYTAPVCEFKDGKVLTVSMQIQKASGRWETKTFNEYHFEKWKAASAKRNGGVANASYSMCKGGIDPIFAATKCIRHSLKNLGTNPNAKLAERIQIEKPRIIPIEVAMNEAREEIAPANAANDTSATYHVQVHDAIEIKSNGEVKNLQTETEFE